MNEIVACLPLIGSVVWTLRPRPPARRLDTSPSPPTVSAPVPSPPAPLRRRAVRPVDAVALARWCESIARRVRGGDALRTAIEQPPDDASIGPSVDAVRRHVLDPGRAAPLSPDTALVAAVMTACLEQGGPSAEPLDRAAGVLRARAAERDERRVQSAQARLSAAVLTWLPIGVLTMLVATSGAVRRVVVTPLGATLVVVGVLFELAGWWWMRRIVERAGR